MPGLTTEDCERPLYYTDDVALQIRPGLKLDGDSRGGHFEDDRRIQGVSKIKIQTGFIKSYGRGFLFTI